MFFAERYIVDWGRLPPFFCVADWCGFFIGLFVCGRGFIGRMGEVCVKNSLPDCF